MPRSSQAAYAARLRTLYGFDKAHVVTEDGTKYVRAGCSQCQVVCVNGTPLHEQGCPHERRHDDDDEDEDD